MIHMLPYDDVDDMVPYDVGDNILTNFFILPWCDAGCRSLLIGDRLENC